MTSRYDLSVAAGHVKLAGSIFKRANSRLRKYRVCGARGGHGQFTKAADNLIYRSIKAASMALDILGRD